MNQSAGPTIRASRLALLAGLAAVSLALAVARPGLAAAAEPRLRDIKIEPAEVTLIPGRTQAFTATGVYSDETTKDLTALVVWKVRDTRVAVIDLSGAATAVDSGRTDVSAELVAEEVTSRRRARLEVAELDKLSVAPTSATVRVGGRIPLRAVGDFDDGTTGIDLTELVEWYSLKPSLVEVERDELGQIVARGVARGETNVGALHPQSGVRSRSNTGKIKVVSSLVGVRVTPDLRVARVGERAQFKATGTFERGAMADVSGDVDWSTGEPGVATIDGIGRATGAAMGSTSIVATDRATGIASTASGGDGRIDVVGDMTSLQVKPSPMDMALGVQRSLKAQATFVGLSGRLNVSSRVTWISSDPAKVSVNRLGLATCLAAATVTVAVRDPVSGLTSTATGGNATVHCGVPVLGVRIVSETLSLRVGKSKKIKAYLLYSDNSRDEVTKRVIWSSSDPLVATVDGADPNIGRVNALVPGQTTISVDDPVTGLGSSAPGGASCAVTVKP